MIKISLEKNKERVKDILSKHSLDESCVVMSAYDENKFVGYAAAEVEGHTLNVKAFCVNSCTDYTNPSGEEKFIAELLIRSIANYGANRNMILLTGDNNNLFFSAVLLGINSSKDSVRIFIPSLLSGCKNNNN